jgi:FtsZ-binding cell division protein ZapB
MESRKCDCGFEDRLLAKIAALKEEVERLEDQFSAACETIKITADERDALAAKMAEVERLKEKNLFLQTQVWDLDALAADLKAENERLRARGEELRNGIDTILFAAGIAVNAPRPNWQVIVDELRILASRQKEKE